MRVQFALDRAEGITATTPVAVDLSDVSKPHAKKMEYLATVRDASDSSLRGGTILNPGYWMFESYLALGREAQPIPVVCFPFSVEDPRIGSQNRALEEGFRRLQAALGGKGVLYLDRGFDGDRVFQALEALQMRFVCRLVGTRTLLDAERHRLGLAHEVAERMAPTHRITVPVWRKHAWKKKTLDVSWREVRIPDTGELYTLIRVGGAPGEAPGMMLFTNEIVHTLSDVLRIVRDYFRRWRAEDAIRVLKQELGIETVRVFDFDSIRRLVEFAFWILALVSLISLELSDDQRELLTLASASWATPILLFHYRILAVLRLSFARHGPRFLGVRRLSGAKV